jgi:hypothetical protein
MSNASSTSFSWHCVVSEVRTCRSQADHASEFVSRYVIGPADMISEWLTWNDFSLCLCCLAYFHNKGGPVPYLCLIVDHSQSSGLYLC